MHLMAARLLLFMYFLLRNENEVYCCCKGSTLLIVKFILAEVANPPNMGILLSTNFADTLIYGQKAEKPALQTIYGPPI